MRRKRRPGVLVGITSVASQFVDGLPVHNWNPTVERRDPTRSEIYLRQRYTSLVRAQMWGAIRRSPALMGHMHEGRVMRELMTRLMLSRPESILGLVVNARVEFSFQIIADKILAQDRSSRLWIREKGITRAGRSHFGKFFCKFNQCCFEFCAVPIRFLVEGKGRTRKYVLVLVDQSQAASAMLFSAGVEAILRGCSALRVSRLL